LSLSNIILHERSDMESDSWITDDSYVLTKQGWKPVWNIYNGTEILCSDQEFKYSWYTIENIHEGFKGVVELSHSFWKFKYSKDNKVFGYRRMTLSDNSRKHILDHRNVDNLSCEFHIRNSATFRNNSETNITEDECRLLGWLLSDGYISWSKKSERTSASFGKRKGVIATVTQNDNKYGKEIENLMNRLGCLSFSHKRKRSPNVCRNYYIESQWFRDYWEKLGFERLCKYKIDLVGFIIDQPTSNVEAFMDAFQKADGHLSKNGIKVITQNWTNISEGVHLAGILSGYNVSTGSKGFYTNKTGKTNECLWYKFQNKPHQTTMKVVKEDLPPQKCYKLFDGNIYPLVRQERYTSIV